MFINEAFSYLKKFVFTIILQNSCYTFYPSKIIIEKERSSNTTSLYRIWFINIFCL